MIFITPQLLRPANRFVPSFRDPLLLYPVCTSLTALLEFGHHLSEHINRFQKTSPHFCNDSAKSHFPPPPIEPTFVKFTCNPLLIRPNRQKGLLLQPNIHRRTPKAISKKSNTLKAPFPSTFNTIRTLSAAPFFRTYSPQPQYLASAEEFFEENPLIAATLKPTTQTKYAIALESFKASTVANDPTHLSRDQRLAIHIQERYIANPGPGQRQEMSNLICIVALMYPSVKQDLGLARRCLSGWKTLKPSRSSAPFTKEIVLTLAWVMVTNGKIESATVLLTSISACLRVSEALNITWRRVALPGDLRLAAYPAGTARVNIQDAKTSRYTGKLQFVKLADQHGINLLSALKQRNPQNIGRIASISYQRYTDELRQSLAHFQLEKTPFPTHSAHIGKETEDYIRGEPVEQIAIKGRWKSMASLRYYLNDGRAWILNTPITSNHQRTLSLAAAKMKHALTGYNA